MSHKPGHFDGLDLVRILACALVLLNHLAVFSFQGVAITPATGDEAFPILAPFADVGAVGVQIFFVISGFVISFSSMRTSPSGFILNRAARILPTLWLCALIALVARLATEGVSSALFFAFAKSAVLSPIGPYIDGVVWTLVVEAAFYILVFLVMWRFQVSPRALLRLALALSLASGAFVALSAGVKLAGSETFAGSYFAIAERFWFKVALLRHGVFFACGIVLWAIAAGHIGRSGWLWLAVLTALGLMEIAGFAHDPGVGLASAAVWFAGLALIVISVLFSPAIHRALSPVLRVTRELGNLSYPLYLNHYVLGAAITPPLFALLGPGWALAGVLFVLVGSSLMISLFVEKPLQSGFKALFAGDAGRPGRPLPVAGSRS